MNLHGFVTVGRTELLLTLISVALLMAAAGWAAGQIVMMIRRPAVVKPEPCARLHCETADELNSWLFRCDYSLITNEALHDLQTRVLPKPLTLPPPDSPKWPTPEELDALIEKLDAKIGKHRKGDS